MIAHRLNTIKSAENLLHLQDNRTIVAAKKGTQLYDGIIEEISKTNYAH